LEEDCIPIRLQTKKLTRAEIDTKKIIYRGIFHRAPTGRGKMHPSIMDFFNHTYTFVNIDKETHVEDVTRFINEQEEPDNDPEEKVKEYFDLTMIKRATESQTEVIEVESSSWSTLRKRKSSRKDTSTPQEPISTPKQQRSSTNKFILKQIVGRSQGIRPKKSLTTLNP
jgi:hypothetical protein